MVVAKAKKKTATKKTTRRVPGMDALAQTRYREQMKLKRLDVKLDQALDERDRAYFAFGQITPNTKEQFRRLDVAERRFYTAQSRVKEIRTEIAKTQKKIVELDKRWDKAWAREKPKERQAFKSLSK